MSWFSKVQREFSEAVGSFAGQPIQYVEIGVWEGDSAEWMLENVLTHQQARGIGIDPYCKTGDWDEADYEAALATATKRLSRFPNWMLVRRSSADALRNWQAGPIDVLYVDGMHFAHLALIDFALAWRHLRVGSVVVFDDYGIGQHKRLPHVPETVRAIELTFQGLIEPIGLRKSQAAFRVIAEHPTSRWIADQRHRFKREE